MTLISNGRLEKQAFEGPGSIEELQVNVRSKLELWLAGHA